jgi:hypothetical protein
METKRRVRRLKGEKKVWKDKNRLGIETAECKEAE